MILDHLKTTIVSVMLLLAASVETYCQALNYSSDSSGFVEVSEAVPDVILEIRYYSTYNFVGERIDGYERPIALMTKEAAAALKKASDELIKKGYRIKVFDAYRPQIAVDHFARWGRNLSDTLMKSVFYPTTDKKVLFKEGFIAHRSGHTRGSTIDLTILDMLTGKEVDMGGPFDFFGEVSHPSYEGITAEQMQNRKILRDAMVNAGFRPMSTEWWHYTLRDEPYPDTYFTFPVRNLK